MMTEKIKMGISACLLGERVRYDGSHKMDHYLAETLGRYVEWVPVCPEVEMGLSVPREPLRLVGEPSSPHLMTVKTGVDLTDSMKSWAQKRLRELETAGLCGFVFKSKSPSSGMRSVKVYRSNGSVSRTGVGIFARAFMERFPLIPVEDDGRLQNPEIRENFIERVFVFHRWRQMLSQGGSIDDLMDFHTRHKLIILSHSPRHLKELGRLVAGVTKRNKERVFLEYITLLMEALKLLATKKKNTNVLHHIMGYFKKHLSEWEKKEILGLIDNYYRGLVPLIVPIVLIRHYVKRFEQPYLLKQWYIYPYPMELMLRNGASRKFDTRLKTTRSAPASGVPFPEQTGGSMGN